MRRVSQITTPVNNRNSPAGGETTVWFWFPPFGSNVIFLHSGASVFHTERNIAAMAVYSSLPCVQRRVLINYFYERPTLLKSDENTFNKHPGLQ